MARAPVALMAACVLLEAASPAAAQHEALARDGLELDATLRLPSGRGLGLGDGYGDEYGLFIWVGLDLAGRYAVTDEVAVAVEVPLAVIKPFDFTEVVGGALAGVDVLRGNLGGHVRVGVLEASGWLQSSFDVPYYDGGYKAGGVVGPFVAWGDRRARSSVGVDLVVAAEADTSIYPVDDPETLIALRLPLVVRFPVAQHVAIGGETGLYSGPDVAIEPSRGGRVPVALVATFAAGQWLFDAKGGYAAAFTTRDGTAVRDHSLTFLLSARVASW
jgi:hypothetical protein